ncbi:major facilitator superfamily domain-containing protein [Sporodiniella umbellata]|nr:major facilitator superfamily domain-containing protein [Sporodiniella umbellata]
MSIQKTTGEALENTFTRQEIKTLVNTLDIRIMPLFCLFYFADFLDRANIGNAALAGLQTDLAILLEIPSNWILEKSNSTKWLSLLMFIWGLATLSMAFVNSFVGLLITRLILGAAESGFVPGILFVLSKVYTAEEYPLRVSILLTMGTLSGAVSGPLSWGLTRLKGPWHGWQYLFFIEGLGTLFLSVVSYYVLFDDLQRVSWLTIDQKKLQSQRLPLVSPLSSPNSPRVFYSALFDWKTWAFGLLFFLNGIFVVSFGVFSPALIQGFGFDPQTAQLLTAPPCLTGTLGLLLGGFLVVRFNLRSPFLAFGAFLIALGYLSLYFLFFLYISILGGNGLACYTVLLIIPFGIGLQAASSFGWSALNYPDLKVRAIAVAGILTIGNLGCFVASFLFQASDAPRYKLAILFNFCSAILSILVAVLVGAKFHQLNRRIDFTLENSFKYYI